MRVAILIIMAIGLAGCKETRFNLIHGMYLDGCELKSNANAELVLVDQDQNEILATGTTDKTGNFRLVYDRELGERASLAIMNSQSDIIFTDIPKSEAQYQILFDENFISYELTLVDTNLKYQGDTFILSIGNVECTETVTLRDIEDKYDIESFQFIINSKRSKHTLYNVIGPYYKEVNFPKDSSNSGFAWGIGLADFYKSYHSGAIIEGVQIYPDYYHRFKVDHAPYPEVNEFEIVLE